MECNTRLIWVKITQERKINYTFFDKQLEVRPSFQNC